MQLSAEQDVSSEGSTYAKLDKVERIIPEKSDKIIQYYGIHSLKKYFDKFDRLSEEKM